MLRHKKQKYIAVLAVGLFLSAVVFYAWPNSATTPTKSSSKALPTPSAATTPSFDKNQYPIDNASSLWAVVNKGRALPSTYVPAGLVAPNLPLRLSASSSEMHVRSDAAAAMEQMFTVAKAQGINLKLASGYRSYLEQVSVHQGYANSQGAAAADTFSARAGHSEHQTGLAADIEPLSGQCELDVCFETTAEGKWLAANSYKYGFIIRYQKATQGLTGYQYEPWHVRYVGVGLAAQLYSSGQTMEQFFGLPAITDYPNSSSELK